MLAPSEELHLVVESHTGIPAIGTARKTIPEVESAACSIFEIDAGTQTGTAFGTCDDGVYLSLELQVKECLS